MSELNKFDNWINDAGPAALVIREHLIPVEGADGVFFPATYAAQQGADKDKEKFQGGYNIDIFPDGTNVCLVDSVGSQANRIEPLFATSGYATSSRKSSSPSQRKGFELNLLHANHRAADAIIRCSPFEQELRTAFQEVSSRQRGETREIRPHVAGVRRVGFPRHVRESAPVAVVHHSRVQRAQDTRGRRTS